MPSFFIYACVNTNRKKIVLHFWALGVCEPPGTAVIPHVCIVASEKLSASARRRCEIQVLRM